MDFEEALKTTSEENLPSRVESDMLMACGIDPSDLRDEYDLISIPITDIQKYGTACGEAHNKCFKANTIKWLNDMNITSVYAVTYVEVSSICSMAFKLDFDSNVSQIEKFSKMIDNNGGSLRPDVSLKGWTVFESE